MVDAQRLDRAMKRLAEGDGQAFDFVFAELWPVLLRYCRRALPRGDQAEDAAQRALLQLFEHASEYDSKRSALAWALSFAFWECRTERTRERRRRITSDDDTELPTDDHSPEEALARAEELAAVKGLLEDLPAAEQALLWQEVEPELTRALHGVKPSTIRKRRERLLSKLRIAFRRLVWPTEEA